MITVSFVRSIDSACNAVALPPAPSCTHVIVSFTESCLCVFCLAACRYARLRVSTTQAKHHSAGLMLTDWQSTLGCLRYLLSVLHVTLKAQNIPASTKRIVISLT